MWVSSLRFRFAAEEVLLLENIKPFCVEVDVGGLKPQTLNLGEGWGGVRLSSVSGPLRVYGRNLKLPLKQRSGFRVQG